MCILYLACGTFTSNIWFPNGLRTASLDCALGEAPLEEFPPPCAVEAVLGLVPCVKRGAVSHECSVLPDENACLFPRLVLLREVGTMMRTCKGGIIKTVQAIKEK